MLLKLRKHLVQGHFYEKLLLITLLMFTTIFQITQYCNCNWKSIISKLKKIMVFEIDSLSLLAFRIIHLSNLKPLYVKKISVFLVIQVIEVRLYFNLTLLYGSKCSTNTSIIFLNVISNFIASFGIEIYGEMSLGHSMNKTNVSKSNFFLQKKL